MTIHYTFLDPTGNYTLLVHDPVDKALQPGVAARLMALEPLAEQVGFLSAADADSICMRMAGGEFCGNASMSAAVYLAEETGRTQAQLTVHVQDVNVTVRTWVQKTAESCWTGTVEMPLPLSITNQSLPGGVTLPVVEFPGICHVINELSMDRDALQTFAPKWCAQLEAQALGVMQFDRSEMRLTPLVWVPSAETMFWENACASGTAALGYYLYAQASSPLRAQIAQPGGILDISVDNHGILSLTGTVRIMCSKEVSL